MSGREARGFRPNGLLEITPDFLDRTLGLIRAEGYDLVSSTKRSFGWRRRARAASSSR